MEINRIEPEGWLRRYLEVQRDGLTGHLEHAKFPFDTGGWNRTDVKNRGGDAWWPYEQTGYWFDGMVRCAYLLRDPALLAKALRPIRFVLARPDRDGYLGPAFMKGPKGWLRWAHAVFFRAVMAHHSATGDRAILRKLTRHYLSKTAPHTDGRDVCNVEILSFLATPARAGWFVAAGCMATLAGMSKPPFGLLLPFVLAAFVETRWEAWRIRRRVPAADVAAMLAAGCGSVAVAFVVHPYLFLEPGRFRAAMAYMNTTVHGGGAFWHAPSLAHWCRVVFARDWIVLGGLASAVIILADRRRARTCANWRQRPGTSKASTWAFQAAAVRSAPPAVLGMAPR